jgi:hypothetical protein
LLATWAADQGADAGADSELGIERLPEVAAQVCVTACPVVFSDQMVEHIKRQNPLGRDRAGKRRDAVQVVRRGYMFHRHILSALSNLGHCMIRP